MVGTVATERCDNEVYNALLIGYPLGVCCPDCYPWTTKEELTDYAPLHEPVHSGKIEVITEWRTGRMYLSPEDAGRRIRAWVECGHDLNIDYKEGGLDDC